MTYRVQCDPETIEFIKANQGEFNIVVRSKDCEVNGYREYLVDTKTRVYARIRSSKTQDQILVAISQMREWLNTGVTYRYHNFPEYTM